MDSWIAGRPIRVPLAAAAVLLGVLAGCGSSGPTLLDESARAGLHTQVEDIRSALGDRTRAAAALERFRAEVRRLREEGDLAAADADVLLDHAARIESQVRAESPLPRPTPAVVAEPPKDEVKRDEVRREEVKPAEGGGEEKPGKDQGKGKGKGKQKGGGDD